MHVLNTAGSLLQIRHQVIFFFCVASFLLAFLGLNRTVSAQQHDTIKVATYNLLNYPAVSSFTSDTTTRNPHFRVVMAGMLPDILVVQELNSSNGLNGFVSNVMNKVSSGYAAGTFIDGPDTDNGVVYRTSKFQFLGNTRIRTALRDINEFKFKHILSGDTIRVFSLHLKASSGSTNEAQRAAEVDSLRKYTNALPLGSNFIVCGDFNIYSSTESAYVKLLQVTAGNEGHVIDPYTLTGSWNSSSFAIHHSQSTRTRSFGGGSTGGLDDRFDFLLHSKALSQNGGVKYVSSSMKAYGNDGNHYNDSINRQPNTSVSAAIANALHDASDHLPVFAKYTFEYSTAAIVDAGVTAILSPGSSACPNPVQSLQVQIRNYGSDSLHFANNNLNVVLKITNPTASVQTFVKLLNTGSLASGQYMSVLFNSTYDLGMPGNYVLNSYTSFSNDVNHNNDTLPAQTVTVFSSPLATVNPPGPLTLCSGSVTLTASTGVSYLWSTGATTQSVTVSFPGSYYVQVSNSNGCSSTSDTVFITQGGGTVSGTVFTESMGSVSSTTAITTHENNNGFDNIPLTMAGSGDVRNTQSSLGTYPGASGGANVFLTNVAGRNFIISDIDASGKNNLELSFGVYKSSTTSNGSDFQVLVSDDGVNYSPLSFAALPTGSGTARWEYRTAIGTIPSASNLRIQFLQSGTATQYRVDDVLLTYNGVTPQISAGGPSNFCQGDSVVLTASPGSAYLWSTGSTNQSITVYNSGNYSVEVDCYSSNPFSVNVQVCDTLTLNLTAFLEGFYIGGGMMRAVSDPISHPTICDTVVVELASVIAPYDVMFDSRSTLNTDGTGVFRFPGAPLSGSFYLVIRHRNSIETWSAAPISLNGSTFSYNFSSSALQAYGSNLQNMGGVYGIHTGDISDGNISGNQDGLVDPLDLSSLEMAFAQFLTGYIVFDLNGDGVLESADYSLLENKLNQFISIMRP